ncbi:MAG: hypothetical protein U0230_12225 [Polyangiales bacterium]
MRTCGEAWSNAFGPGLAYASGARFVVVALLATVVGCSDGPAAPASQPEATSAAQSALIGTDGALTVNAANTVLNQYAVLGANAAVGATSLTVTNIADLTSATYGALAAGDLILVVQMQGATIDSTNTATYGAVTAFNGAGNYELIGVAGVSGNVVQLDPTGGGLKNAYTTTGRTQIVRIPQLSSLTVNAGASIVPTAWDGTRGGVVAVHVTGTAAIQGTVDASGAGFRGGVVDNNSNGPGSNTTVYRSASSNDGAEKGESIAGFQTEYDALNGRYGRGAPANGGGGGDSHNAGGGGGANASAVAGTWTGAGTMLVTPSSPLSAWALDPAYIANGNALTASPGGGRGGYTYSSNNADATTVAPGNGAWGGDSRREVGGLGGRPLSPSANGRLFFGGGGGAGDANNSVGGAGGRGGGLVLLIAGTVNGSGSIRANGANGASTTGAGNDAPGGGGAGGTLVIQATSLGGVSAQANGGVGGNQSIGSAEAEGPGGGGGGGFIATSGGTITVSAAGGTGGTTNSSALTEFTANGATAGGAGDSSASAATLVGLVDGTPPDTSITSQPPVASSSTSASFSFSSTDANPTYQCRLDAGAWTACTSPRTYAGLSEASHTFEVRSLDPSLNVDPTPASYTWTVDLTAPDTTITSGPPTTSTSRAATFTFTSSDNTVTFECSVDGGAFTVCTSPLGLTGLADGAHSLSVRAVDPAGNVDSTPANYAWTVDATPPDTQITSQPPAATSSSSASFAFSSPDATATFRCSLDGAPFAVCTTPLTYVGLADGSHTFAVEAVDPAGNIDPTPASYTWTVDTLPPDTTLTSVPPLVGSSPAVSFGFTSNDGGASFECRVDGGAFSACTSPTMLGALADGSHTFEVRAVDAVGNADPTPASYTFTIDTIAPDTVLTSTPPSISASSSAGFQFASLGGGVAFVCVVDGGAPTPCSSPLSLTGLADGSHTLEVSAVDAAGNVDPTPASYTWTVDTSPPDTAITSQPADPTASVDAVFAFSAPDGTATFECSLDGGAFTACATGQSYQGLAEGGHAFAVRAVDAAGNVDPTPATYAWTVDTTAPDTSIVSGPADPTNQTSASFTFGSPDPTATFQCDLDGAGFAPCNASEVFSGLSEGNHTLAVRAVDAAGNVDATPANYGWVVDLTPPDTSITSAPPSVDNATTVTFAFTSTEAGATFECSTDGGPFVPCASGTTVSGLSAGSHTFEVRSVDAAGNVDPTPASYTWTIDTSTPDTQLTAHPNALTNVPDATFEFTSNDATATFECSFDGAAFAPCTSPTIESGLAEGDHTFSVRARNTAGTVDATPASFTFTVDTTPPDTAFATQPPAEFTTATPTFTFTSPDASATFECSLDGAAFTACPATYTTPTLVLGMHDLVVRAVDPAGNVDPTPISHEFLVVTVPLDGGLPDAGADGGEDAGADAGPDGGVTDGGTDAGHGRGGVVGGACSCRAAGAGSGASDASWSFGALVLGLVFARVRRRRSARGVREG